MISIPNHILSKFLKLSVYQLQPQTYLNCLQTELCNRFLNFKYGVSPEEFIYYEQFPRERLQKVMFDDVSTGTGPLVNGFFPLRETSSNTLHSRYSILLDREKIILQMIEGLKKTDKMFTFIDFTIQWENNKYIGSHKNMLIYDKKLNTIFRFDPYGYIICHQPKNYSQQKIDDQLEMEFKKYDIKYENMKWRYGPQYYDEDKSTIDPTGYCTHWCLAFVEFIISNEGNYIEINEQQRFFMEKIEKSNNTYLQYIRNWTIENLEYFIYWEQYIQCIPRYIQKDYSDIIKKVIDCQIPKWLKLDLFN